MMTEHLQGILTTAVIHGVSWLLTYAIHSTLLIGGVWLVTRLFELRAPVLRDTLWKAALVGGVATASWQVAVDGGSFGLRWEFAMQRSDRAAIATGNDDRGVEPNRRATAIEASHPTDAETSELLRELAALHGHRPAAMADDVAVRDLLARTPGAGGTANRSPAAGVDALGEWLDLRGADAGGNAGPEPRQEGHLLRGREADRLDQRVADAASRGLGRIVRAAALALSTALLAMHRAFSPESQFAALTLAWLIGAGLGLTRFVRSYARLSWVLADRRPVGDERLEALLAELCRRGRVRRRIRLTACSKLSGPVAVGLREICLPERALVELAPAQQQGALAHELAHLVRLDPLWLALATLIETVFFFQPLNRLATRELRDASEFLCDDWAVERTGDRVPLARCLAEVATWIGESASTAPVMGMADHHSPLVRRIHRLLDDRQTRAERAYRQARLPAVFASMIVLASLAPQVTAVHPGCAGSVSSTGISANATVESSTSPHFVPIVVGPDPDRDRDETVYLPASLATDSGDAAVVEEEWRR